MKRETLKGIKRVLCGKCKKKFFVTDWEAENIELKCPKCGYSGSHLLSLMPAHPDYMYTDYVIE